MLYLLDANVLIEANAFYYDAGRIPHFWQWLSALASQGTCKIPAPILNEIKPSDSDAAFRSWLSTNRGRLALNEAVSPLVVEFVMRRGYGFPPNNPEDASADRVANDAALISLALLDKESRCVVTMERRQNPNSSLPQPQNRRIPLVCQLLGVRCINTFDLIRELDFRIPLAAAPA